MRIGFDAKRAFNNKTGLGNYSRFVLEALLQYHQEHQYLAYTPKNNRNLFSGFPEELTILPKSALDKKLSFYWRYATITKQLRADNIDIFHGLSHEIPQGLQKSNIRSVVTIHDLIFERLPALFKPVDRIIYRHKFKAACSRADAIVAISEQTKRDIVEIYKVSPERIRVIYQDCNSLFKQQADTEISQKIVRDYGIRSQYIVSVGTLEERKNQLRLVEAFAQLPANDFQLVLIGRATPYTAKIRDFIRHANLEKRVLVLENVPTQHLPALYQQAAVFAYISIYEGFGIPILEALHSGTPVLSAKGSCLEEAGGPGGLYADPSNIADIGEKMQKLISDQSLRDTLVKAGKEYIIRFNGEKIAGELVDLYSGIL